MAYLSKRSGDRIEIRESRTTPNGPRSRTLAAFTGPLNPAILAHAAARATRPFNRVALIRRARAAGIAVSDRSPESEARALLARIRRGDTIDPVMVTLIKTALAQQEASPLPDKRAEVSEWIGASPGERGAALRELVDTFGAIAAARPPRRERPHIVFPHFSSLDQAG